MLQKTKVLALLMAIIGLSFIYSCNDSEDDVTPDEVAMITGKWFLNSESFSMKDASGAVLETETFTYTNNLVSLDFKSDGNFTYLDLSDVSWDEGTYTFDSETSVFTFNTGEENLTGTVTVTDANLTAKLSGTFTDDGETYTQEIELTATKAPAPTASIVLEEFSGKKWSISSQNITMHIDVNFDEVVDETINQTISNIPYNKNTVTFFEDGTFQYIDAYWEGDFTDDDTWEVIDATNIYIDNSEGDDAILHLNSITDGVYSFTAYVAFSDESDGTYYDVFGTQVMEAKPNDGSEVTMTEAEFFGSWEITGFVVKADGVDVTGNDTPVGALLTFNQDGTGALSFNGDPVEDISDVKYIDGSDFCFNINHYDGETELILMNLNSFDESSNTIEVYRGFLDSDENGDDIHMENIITLVKQ